MIEPQQGIRVVLIVLDGMRPDMISASATPNLHALTGRGTRFTGARTVFPSLTRVVSASIATGTPPSVHGVVSNAFYDPRFDTNRVFAPASEEEILDYEQRVGESLVMAPTFADCLAEAGRSLAIVHTGSAMAAHILNPNYRRHDHWKLSFANVRAGTPSPAFNGIRERFGDLPESAMPDAAIAEYASDIFVNHVLAERQPDMAALWLNEPDLTWHYRGLTSPEGQAALQAADAALGKVINWIDGRADRDRYRIIVMSDHGHCQNPEMIDLHGQLSRAGHACRHGDHGDLSDDALAVTGWTVGSVWARDGGETRLRAAADWLSRQDFTGPLFAAPDETGAPLSPAALPLNLTGADHPRQAPLIFPVAVDDQATLHGLPGVGPVFQGCDGERLTMHGGMSRAELHNLMLMVGDNTPAGEEDDRICGVLDIAPTVLDWFGLAAAPTMQGAPLQHSALEATHTSHELSRADYRVRLNIAQRGRASFVQGAERLL